MIANLITLFRLMLVFVVISLFGYHIYLDILLVALIGLILLLEQQTVSRPPMPAVGVFERRDQLGRRRLTQA